MLQRLPGQSSHGQVGIVLGLQRRDVGQDQDDGQDQHSGGGPSQLVDDGVVVAHRNQNDRGGQVDER